MAVTRLLSHQDNTDVAAASSYTTAATSGIVSGQPVVISVLGRYGTGTDISIDAISGTEGLLGIGLSDLVREVQQNVSAAQSLSVFVFTPVSAVDGALTISFEGNMIGCMVTIDTDPDWSDTIVQSGTGFAATGTTASMNVAALGAFASANNHAYLVVAKSDSATGFTAEASGTWALTSTDLIMATPSQIMNAAAQASEDSSPTMTWTGNAVWISIGLEIGEAVGAVEATDSATLTDTAAIADQIARTDAFTLLETAIDVEETDLTVEATLSESVALLDAYTPTDSASLSESAALQDGVSVSDSLSLTDAVNALLDSLSVSDSATLTDTASVVTTPIMAGAVRGTATLTPRMAGTASLED